MVHVGVVHYSNKFYVQHHGVLNIHITNIATSRHKKASTRGPAYESGHIRITIYCEIVYLLSCYQCENFIQILVYSTSVTLNKSGCRWVG